MESLSHGQLFVTPWTVARQAPQSMGFFQARILEWVTISLSKGSSWPRDQTWVSCAAGRFFTKWATGEYCPWRECASSCSVSPHLHPCRWQSRQDRDFANLMGREKNRCFNFHLLDNNQLAHISMIVDPFSHLGASSNSLNVFPLFVLFLLACFLYILSNNFITSFSQYFSPNLSLAF